MKPTLLLFLCLALLPVASAPAQHSKPVDRATQAERAAAERDPVLRKLLENYAPAIDPDAGVDPFGPNPAPPQRPANATPAGETGAYFGTHHPITGIAWLRTLNRADIREEAAAYGKAVITAHPELAFSLYEQLPNGHPKSYYLEGIIAGPRPNQEAVRVKLLQRAADTPGERDIILFALIREEAHADPAAAWQHLQRLGYRSPALILDSLVSFGPVEPFPAMLLDLIPQEDQRIAAALRGMQLCQTAENLAPIEVWLEHAPPSLDTAYLCAAMASEQAPLGHYDKARHWADHLIQPQMHEATLEVIRDLEARSPGRESPPAGGAGNADTGNRHSPDDGLWHHGLAVRRGDPELQRLTTAFNAKIETYPRGQEECRALAKYYASRHPEVGIAWLATFDDFWINPATAEFVGALWAQDPDRAFLLYGQCSTKYLRTHYLKNLAVHAKDRREELWKLAKLDTPDGLHAAIWELVWAEAATDPVGAWNHFRKFSDRKPDLETFLMMLRASPDVPYPAPLLDLLPADRMEEVVRDDILRAVPEGRDPAPDAHARLKPIVEWLETRPVTESHTGLAKILADACRRIGDGVTADRLRERFQPQPGNPPAAEPDGK